MSGPETDAGAPLGAHEREAFLHLGITARLGCIDAEGWPYVVPVWHQWDGERFWVIGAKGARWVTYLRATPQVSLCIDQPETLTRIVVQGTARLVDGPSAGGDWQEIAREMARRYLGPEAVAGYDAATQGLERWVFAIEVRRWRTWRGPGRSETAEATTDPA